MTSSYRSLSKSTVNGAPIKALHKMGYFNLMGGMFVMGSFVGFSLLVWYLIIKLFVML